MDETEREGQRSWQN